MRKNPGDFTNQQRTELPEQIVELQNLTTPELIGKGEIHAEADKYVEMLLQALEVAGVEVVSVDGAEERDITPNKGSTLLSKGDYQGYHRLSLEEQREVFDDLRRQVGVMGDDETGSVISPVFVNYPTVQVYDRDMGETVIQDDRNRATVSYMGLHQLVEVFENPTEYRIFAGVVSICSGEPNKVMIRPAIDKNQAEQLGTQTGTITIISKK